MWYQCGPDGRVRCCKACGDLMRSSPVYDGGREFCSRKPCRRKRVVKWLKNFISAGSTDLGLVIKVKNNPMTMKQLEKLAEAKWKDLSEEERNKAALGSMDLVKSLITNCRC